MKFSKYIKDKINFILGFIIYCVIITLYTNAMKTDKNTQVFIIIISAIFFISGFIINYFVKNKYIKNIEKMMDNLQEKYLITEIIKKPRREENKAYYRILKRANKSMLDNVNDTKISKKEYKEYIESWVHEVKIPITSAKLLCENNKSEITNKIDEEIEEINNFVEQALFYARLDQISNDFMIRKINIEEVIRNIDISVYTDEKWLEFILNQIVINAIKYKREKDSKVTIYTKENKENLEITIEDNGIGIKKSEIDRIFDKGFTGTNGRKETTSTGIGLYLCKKLCEGLEMKIDAESIENEYTKIRITIPRNKKEINT